MGAVKQDLEERTINKADEIATQNDFIYDQMRENGHKPKKEREAFWADLELDRRLGK